jgi:hypothetical protein
MKIKLSKQIKLSRQAKAYLDQLVATGLYGTNRKECAQRLIEESIRDLLQAELLERKDNP